MMFFALLISIMSVFAQEPMVEKHHQTFALLVATENFMNTDLARQDAKALCFKNALALYGSIPTSNVIALCDSEKATRANILASATQIQDNAEVGDTVLFVFIGLGVGSDFGEPMFLAYDTVPTTDDIANTSIRIDELISSMSKDGIQLVLLIDASLQQSIKLETEGGQQSLMTAGPVATDVSGKYLSLSSSTGAGNWPQNPIIFGEALSQALSGGADLNQDMQISPSEINSFMVMQINTQTGMPPGVRGEWKSAVNPILMLKLDEQIVPESETKTACRPTASRQLKRASMISGASMLAISAVTYGLSWQAQSCLEDVCYESHKEYNSVLARRNSLLWISRGSGMLGVLGIGGGIILQPENVTISVTASW